LRLQQLESIVRGVQANCRSLAPDFPAILNINSDMFAILFDQ
jgi:hypothetical protein